MCVIFFFFSRSTGDLSIINTVQINLATILRREFCCSGGAVFRLFFSPGFFKTRLLFFSGGNSRIGR